MKIPQECICSFCKKVFCCGKCREKHEIKNHAIRIRQHGKETASKINKIKDQSSDFLYVICPICVNKPFILLHEVIYPELLDHIKQKHLPLNCQKCAKVYENVGDLLEFSNCAPPVTPTFEKELGKEALESSCVLEKVTQSFISQPKTISTQTSPHLVNQFNGTSSMTPISVFNLQWKTKQKAANHQDITDSVSSIKNLSSIANSTSWRRSIGSVNNAATKGKLVRTTSTPVQTETENSKPKEQTFNGSGGQVSSIYNSGCDAENPNSPAVAHAGAGGSTVATNNNHQPETLSLYRKFNGRTKIAAVTPLRQVMSKSIQKAFAEHGISSYSDQKIAEPIDGDSSLAGDGSSCKPLDLRLSPALRRNQDETLYITKVKVSREAEIRKLSSATTKDERNRIISEKHMQTTESIVITHTHHQVSNYETSEDQQQQQYKRNSMNGASLSLSSISTNSIYKTCQSFEIISSSTADINDIENEIPSNEENTELAIGLKNPKGNDATSDDENMVPPITPINRLAGSSINKKIIKFETPKGENQSKSITPAVENFYTPISSPNCSDESRNLTNDSSPKLAAISRDLTERFLPFRRPPINRLNSFIPSYHRNDDDEIDEAYSNDDEVFLEKTDSHSEETQTAGFLKSIVQTVMRLPSLREKPFSFTHRPGIEAKKSPKTSIIKRCASIAGSLVRSTSLMDEQQLRTLKRKRTHTIDTEMNAYRSSSSGLSGSVSSIDLSSNSDLSSSTKRFRIQGRKPIERMRKS